MPRPQGATPKKSPNSVSSVSFLAAMLVGALLTTGVFLFLYLWNPFAENKASEQHTAMIQPKGQGTAPKTEYEFYDLLREQQVGGVPNDALASQPTPTEPPKPDVVVTAPARTNDKPASASDANVATMDNPTLPEEPAMSPSPTVTVVTPNGQTATDETPSKPRISAAEPAKTYILQINSFDNIDDADKRRAEVLMAGVDAQIVKRRLSDDTMVYQVISRVMNSPQQVADAQQRLQSSGIDSLIVEQRRSNQ